MAGRWLPAFVMTFATIQLVDTLLWIALRTRSRSLNRWTSRAVLPTVLLAECWVNYLCAVRLVGWRSRLFEAALGVYTVAVFVHWFTTCQTTTVGDAGYLRWCGERSAISDPHKILFALCLLLPLMAAFPAGPLRAQGCSHRERTCARSGDRRGGAHIFACIPPLGLWGAVVLVGERIVRTGGADGDCR